MFERLLHNRLNESRANRIQVKLWNGKEYEADPIVATQGSDVALLTALGQAASNRGNGGESSRLFPQPPSWPRR